MTKRLIALVLVLCWASLAQAQTWQFYNFKITEGKNVTVGGDLLVTNSITLEAVTPDTVAAFNGLKQLTNSTLSLSELQMGMGVPHVLYVATNGNDTTATKGNSGLPWATLTNAVDSATDGDIIYVLPGDHYVIDSAVNLPDNVSIVAMPGTVRIISNSDYVTTDEGVTLSPGDNSYVYGLDIRNTNGPSISDHGGAFGYSQNFNTKASTNVTVRDCRFEGNTDAVFYSSPDFYSVEFYNCLFYHTYDGVLNSGPTNALMRFLGCTWIGTNNLNSSDLGVSTCRGIYNVGARAILENCSMDLKGGQYACGVDNSPNGRVWFRNSHLDVALSSGDNLWATNAGNVWFEGTPVAKSQLSGGGTFHFGDGSFGSFRLGTSSTAGYVLTTDVNGVGTWQAAAGGGGSGPIEVFTDGTSVGIETNLGFNVSSQIQFAGSVGSGAEDTNILTAAILPLAPFTNAINYADAGSLAIIFDDFSSGGTLIGMGSDPGSLTLSDYFLATDDASLLLNAVGGGANVIDFAIGGSSKVDISATSFSPVNNVAFDLGTPSMRFRTNYVSQIQSSNVVVQRSLTMNNLTASKVMVVNGANQPTNSTVTPTELDYLIGGTRNIENAHLDSTNNITAWIRRPSQVITGTEIDWSVSLHRYVTLTADTVFTFADVTTNTYHGVHIMFGSDGLGPWQVTLPEMGDYPNGGTNIFDVGDSLIDVVVSRENGIMRMWINTPSALTNLVDVHITSPSDGQGLVYDGVSGVWTNGTVGGSGEVNTIVSDGAVGIVNPKAGDVLHVKGMNADQFATNGNDISIKGGALMTNPITYERFELNGGSYGFVWTNGASSQVSGTFGGSPSIKLDANIATGGLQMGILQQLSWYSGVDLSDGGESNIFHVRAESTGNALGLFRDVDRIGTEFRMYNVDGGDAGDGDDNERAFFRWTNNVFQIGTEALPNLTQVTNRPIEFWTHYARRLIIATNGPVIVPNNLIVTNQFQYAASPGNGYLLVSDANGVGTWTAPATAVGSYTDEIFIPASYMISNITLGATFNTQERWGGSTNRMTDAYLFSDATTNSVGFEYAFPENWNAGTIKAKFWWESTNAIANQTNVWSIQATAFSHDDSQQVAWGTAQTVASPVTAANDLILSAATSAITIGNTPAAGDMVTFRVQRLGAHADDAMSSGQSRLRGVWIQYTRTGLGVTAW